MQEGSACSLEICFSTWTVLPTSRCLLLAVGRASRNVRQSWRVQGLQARETWSGVVDTRPARSLRLPLMRRFRQLLAGRLEVLASLRNTAKALVR